MERGQEPSNAPDSAADPRLRDLLREKRSGAFVSVEFFPPKSPEGVDNLFKTLGSLMQMRPRPLFVDFTWGAGGSTSDLTLDLCIRAKRLHGAVPNMHLTCTNMESAKIDAALQGCREHGITNVLALRGDPPAGQDRWVAADGGFSCAKDLVLHIRQKHGDFFSIAVAGYPEGHPDSMQEVEDLERLSQTEQGRASRRGSVCLDADFKSELEYLKSKVEAGADVIITQMFFDPEVYATFVSSCREHGITVPILPGIMCLNSYGGFVRMTNVMLTSSSYLDNSFSSARVGCPRSSWPPWSGSRTTRPRCSSSPSTSESGSARGCSSWGLRDCTSTHSTPPRSRWRSLRGCTWNEAGVISNFLNKTSVSILLRLTVHECMIASPRLSGYMGYIT